MEAMLLHSVNRFVHGSNIERGKLASEAEVAEKAVGEKESFCRHKIHRTSSATCMTKARATNPFVALNVKGMRPTDGERRSQHKHLGTYRSALILYSRYIDLTYAMKLPYTLQTSTNLALNDDKCPALCTYISKRIHITP